MNKLREIELGFLNDTFEKSIAYYESIQNSDGGFPYNDVGSPSGFWATSGILWSIVQISKYQNSKFLQKATDYLSKNLSYEGYLPLTISGDKPNIDGTAQFLLALSVIYQENKNEEILKKINKITEWLCRITTNGGYGFFS